MKDDAFRFVATSENGSTVEVTGTLGAAGLAGRFVYTDAEDRAHPLESAFARQLDAAQNEAQLDQALNSSQR